MRMPEARRAWMEVLQTLRDNRCQAKLLIPSKTINTIAVERKKSVIRLELSNIYLPIHLYRRHQKENFSLKGLRTPKKTQEINNLRKANQKWERHLNNKITGCLLIILDINDPGYPIKRYKLTDWIRKKSTSF